MVSLMNFVKISKKLESIPARLATTYPSSQVGTNVSLLIIGVFYFVK